MYFTKLGVKMLIIKLSPLAGQGFSCQNILYMSFPNPATMRPSYWIKCPFNTLLQKWLRSFGLIPTFKCLTYFFFFAYLYSCLISQQTLDFYSHKPSSALMQESISSDWATSMNCTCGVGHVKRTPYLFLPHLTSKGPKWSVFRCVKGDLTLL